MHVDDKDLVSTLSDQAGAPLLAAVYARKDTAVGPARWLGPIANYLIVRPAARAAANREGDAAGIPLDAAVVLGATASELHVWSADPMLSQVKDHLGSVPLDRITGAAAVPGKGWWDLTLTFVGGETVELQARGDVPGLVAPIESPAA